MPGCVKLHKLPPQASRPSSVRFRNQTPGTLVYSSKAPRPQHRLDPDHPIEHDPKRPKPLIWTANAAFALGATPMGLLVTPGKVPRRDGSLELRHRPYLDLPFDPWFDRVARARASGRKELIAPMLPVNGRPGTLPMSVQFRCSVAKPETYLRNRVTRRFKAAVALVVVRGADVQEKKTKEKHPRLVLNPKHVPEQWILQGWTYILQWSPKMIRLSYPELIRSLRPMLRKIFDEGTAAEKRWAQITARMPIPVSTLIPVARPQSEREPDLNFDPFHSMPTPLREPRRLPERVNFQPTWRTEHTPGFGLREDDDYGEADTRDVEPLPFQDSTLAPRRRIPFGLREDDPDVPEHDPLPVRERFQHWTKPTRGLEANAALHRTPFGSLEGDTSGPSDAEPTTTALRDAIFSAVNMRFSQREPTNLAPTSAPPSLDVDRGPWQRDRPPHEDEAVQEQEELDALGFVISQEMKDAWERAAVRGRRNVEAEEDDIGSYQTTDKGRGRMLGRQARLRTALRWKERAAGRGRNQVQTRVDDVDKNEKPKEDDKNEDPKEETDEFGFPVTSAANEEEVAKRLEAAFSAPFNNWEGPDRWKQSGAEPDWWAAGRQAEKQKNESEDRLRGMLFRQRGNK
ncbi:hypothetical protein C8F01DRAFT_1366024 [Mycena amicta]|nr:hypothetical protein C8F01DRAFT_1366024 [Mycena amicta]